MKKNKIKIVAGWDASENVTKRLLDQFLIPDLDIKNIEFVYDNSYDVIVYNNYINEYKKESTKAFLFFHEPSWVGAHQKQFSEDITIFGFDKNLYTAPNGSIIETPACMFYGGSGPYREGWDFWTYKNLSSIDFQKNKKISSIVSCLGKDGNHPEGCIYNQRYELVNYLINNTDYINFYGCKNIEKNNTFDLHLKKDGLIDYQFSLCVENSNEKNYISEKFYDCILTNTIPIYFGCSNIKEIWPMNGYFNIPDINDKVNTKNLLNYISINADNLYQKMLPDLLKIKEQFLKQYNILNIVLKNI